MAPRHYLAFATLAFALIAWSSLCAGPFTGGQYGVTVAKRVAGRHERAPPRRGVGFVRTALLLSTNLVTSRVGRALQAIAANEPAAAASGINVALYKLQLFVFAAALAGLAGGLFTFYAQFLGPEDFVIVLSLLFVVMVSIGAQERLRGCGRGGDDRRVGTSCASSRASLLGYPTAGAVVLSLGVFSLLSSDHALLPTRPASRSPRRHRRGPPASRQTSVEHRAAGTARRRRRLDRSSSSATPSTTASGRPHSRIVTVPADPSTRTIWPVRI
jgi:branched-chain amino acid transport system permease protein